MTDRSHAYDDIRRRSLELVEERRVDASTDTDGVRRLVIQYPDMIHSRHFE